MKISKQKLAYGYVRISDKDPDDPSISPEVQAEQIRCYCAAKGFILQEIFYDLGVSGGRCIEERKAGAKLCAAIANGNCVVIAVRLDRLFRDIEDAISTSRQWLRNDIEPIMIGEGLDLTTPSGRLMFHMLAAFAQYEREITGERVKAINKDKRTRRERVTRHALYGFRFEDSGRQSPSGRPIMIEVLDEKEQEGIRLMRQLRHHGKSYRVIGRELDRRGYPPRSGKRWSAVSVRHILMTTKQRKEQPISAGGETTIDAQSPVDESPADVNEGG